MGDPISKIRSLAAGDAAHVGDLRSSLLKLAERITDALAGSEIEVSSDEIVFEHYGDDEAIYGSLSYSRGELSVAYRSTEEDVMEYVHQNTVDRTYSLKKLQDCPSQWVRVISQERVIGSLLEKVVTTLEQQRSETTAGIKNLSQTLNAPIRDAEAALETAARQLGYDDVVEEWRRAQASLYIDPRDAITRSSSLIETVCKLNQLRIRPRHGRRGWGKSSVLRILRSETYAGVWHYNKHEACTLGHSPTYGDDRRSLRRRPRGEWVPVALPESLRIIPREQWERVQQQLDRNTAFSPRNDRHGYLLKGLLRCGACGARYSGQPCHGRFYYRCLARCKRLPSVGEEVLNDTVWRAVEEAVLNPDLITRQVKNLAERTAKAADAATIQHADIDRAVHQIENEESRILEAYRLGVLSPTQLAAELDGLNVRKTLLNERRATLTTEGGAPSHSELRRSIADFCRLAAQKIECLDPAERQRFLQLLVREVIFEGDRVRIQAIIPPAMVNRNRCDTEAHVDVLIDRVDIATTQAYGCGRNVTPLGPHGSDGLLSNALKSEVAFEIIRPVPHPRTFTAVGDARSTPNSSRAA